MELFAHVTDRRRQHRQSGSSEGQPTSREDAELVDAWERQHGLVNWVVPDRWSSLDDFFLAQPRQFLRRPSIAPLSPMLIDDKLDNYRHQTSTRRFAFPAFVRISCKVAVGTLQTLVILVLGVRSCHLVFRLLHRGLQTLTRCWKRRLHGYSQDTPMQALHIGEHLSALPCELKLEILRHLDAKSAVNLSSASKSWRNLVKEDNILWKWYLERDFDRQMSLVPCLFQPCASAWENYCVHYVAERLRYGQNHALHLRKHDTLAEILDEELLKSLWWTQRILGVLVRFSLACVSFPVHTVLLHRYRGHGWHSYAATRISPRYSSVERVILDLNGQTQLYYRHLWILPGPVPYAWLPPSHAWTLFVVQTWICVPLAICDHVSKLLVLFNRLLLLVLADGIHISAKRVVAKIPRSVNALTALAFFVIQLTMLVAPGIVAIVIRPSDPDGSFFRVLAALISHRSPYPLLQLAWMLLVFGPTQEFTLRHILTRPDLYVCYPQGYRLLELVRLLFMLLLIATILLGCIVHILYIP